MWRRRAERVPRSRVSWSRRDVRRGRTRWSREGGGHTIAGGAPRRSEPPASERCDPSWRRDAGCASPPRAWTIVRTWIPDQGVAAPCPLGDPDPCGRGRRPGPAIVTMRPCLAIRYGSGTLPFQAALEGFGGVLDACPGATSGGESGIPSAARRRSPWPPCRRSCSRYVSRRPMIACGRELPKLSTPLARDSKPPVSSCTMVRPDAFR